MTALISIPFLIILLVLDALLIFCEWRKASTLLTITAMILAHQLFAVTMLQLAVGLPVYILLGVLWSFWRYKNWCAYEIKHHHRPHQYDSSTTNHQELNEERVRQDLELLKSRLAPKVSMIGHWILCWPLSMVLNLVDDMLHALVERIKHIYKSILESVLAKAGLN